jgi:hypothetical protein
MRELAIMARSRRIEEWDRAGAIVAVVRNVNTTKRNQLPPEAFNPYRVADKMAADLADLAALDARIKRKRQAHAAVDESTADVGRATPECGG